MRKAAIAVSLAALAGSIVSQSKVCSAQTVVAIAPTGKGIVGCGLLGAEVVALGESIAGVRARWTYAVFPLLGAAGGAVGGYFLEQGTSSAAIPVATLVVGLGLLIPTTIAFVSATSYRPENDAQPTDDATPATAPLEESAGGAAGSSAPLHTTPATGAPAGTPPAVSQPAAPGPQASVATPHAAHPTLLGAHEPSVVQGLLNLGTEGVSLSVPAISVGNAYTVAEMRQYGVAPVSELRIPVLSGTF